jgi:hypothetical protein
MYDKTEFGSGRVANQIYTIGSTIGFAFAFSMIRHPPQGELTIPALTVTAIAVIIYSTFLSAVARHFDERHKHSNQQKRDQRAQLILEQNRYGLAGDYSLYLRSFCTTGQILANDTSLYAPPAFDFRGSESRYVDLETVFAEVLEIYLPVVTLGTPGEYFGAGRIKTNCN